MRHTHHSRHRTPFFPVLRLSQQWLAPQVRTFEAHTDYIRSIAVHPSLPYLLTSSDDMLIKLWDWDKAWACVQVFEGHSHYVMQVGVWLLSEEREGLGGGSARGTCSAMWGSTCMFQGVELAVLGAGPPLRVDLDAALSRQARPPQGLALPCPVRPPSPRAPPAPRLRPPRHL
jgi:hypothetical protein